MHRLPDWEILPYDQFSPHPDLVSERLATLYQFSQGAFDVGIVPVTTALQRLPPRAYLAARTFFLRQKDRLDLEALKAQLALAGYAAVQQVMAPGEFCVRGGLVDLFPTGSAVPYRLDLLGEEIETIRTFDVDTQRSIYPVTEVRLLPAREFPMDDEGRARFRANFRERFEGDPTQAPRLQGRLQRHRAGGRRVLPAPLLRRDGDALRLPAAGRHLRRCTGRARRRRGLLARPAKPLGAAARRQRPAAPAAGASSTFRPRSSSSPCRACRAST